MLAVSLSAPPRQHPNPLFDVNQASFTCLPREICFELCRHLNWEDMLTLEQASEPMRNLIAQEPLLWAAQLLRSFPVERIPKYVQKCLTSPLAPMLNWRVMFMDMRRVQPAASFMQRSLPGWELPARMCATLKTCGGSDFEKVFSINKRCSFDVEFDALPPGKYIVMCRIKVAPRRKAYISFSAKFNGHRQNKQGSEAGWGNFSEEAGENLPIPAGENLPVAAVLPQAVRPPWPEYISVQVAEGAERAGQEAASTSAAAAASSSSSPSSRSVLSRLWNKYKPNPQFLRGSYSVSWCQVGRPTVLRKASPAGLPPMLCGARVEEHLDNEVQQRQLHEQLSRSSIHAPAPAPLSSVEFTPRKFDSTHWNVVPIGTVTLKAACRSTCISFVALSTNISRLPEAAAPEDSSVFIDYICMSPADNIHSDGLLKSWLCSMPSAAGDGAIKLMKESKKNSSARTR